MPTEKWSALTARATLTTALDALADGSYSPIGSATAIDNASNLDRFCIAELTVDFASAPTDRAAIDIYLVPAPNGTNYADATEPSAYQFVGSFMVDNTAAAQRIVSVRFDIPPCAFKFVLHNRSGQPFPASGSVFTPYTFNRTIN